ncbi:hypothetical protein Q8A73_016770 [Channa argus]|nr:hypothetical protein Q8A73_016770 [Channa argus]
MIMLNYVHLPYKVMASLRLLFLLLVMCHLLVFTMSGSTTEKHLQKMKEVVKTVADHLDDIREAVTPLLGLIDASGLAISAASRDGTVGRVVPTTNQRWILR